MSHHLFYYITKYLITCQKSTGEIDIVKNHIDFLKKFFTSNKNFEKLQEILLEIEKFTPKISLFPDIISTLEKSSEKNITENIHKFLVEKTFQKDEELSVNQIAKKVAEKSKKSAFASSAENIIAEYEKIKTILLSQNQTFKEISSKKISEWSANEISKCTLEIKNKKIFPNRTEIISMVLRAAEMKNKFSPRDTQIISLISLLNKPSISVILSQINTGEGKSLIVAMLAAVLSLEGFFVDVVTTSMELAIPEVDTQTDFFEVLNIFVTHNDIAEDRNKNLEKKVYDHDVVYGTASNFQGDILRTEFMQENLRENRPFHCVIVDEVDSMLFDDRSYCTQLSSTTPAAHHLDILLALSWQYASKLRKHIINYENKIFFIKADFEIKSGEITINSGENISNARIELDNFVEFIEEKTKNHLEKLTCQPSAEENEVYANYKKLHETFCEESLRFERGDKYVPDIHSKLQKIFFNLGFQDQKWQEKNLESLKDNLQNHKLHTFYPKIDLPPYLQNFARSQIPNWVESITSAMFKMKKAIHYNIKNNCIAPIDHSNTGVIQERMVWSNGLAQFLQLKEGLPIESEGISTNFISAAGFFKRYGANLYGLTGTLGNNDTKKFFRDIYNTDIVVIPPYKFRPVAGNENSNYTCKEFPAIICSSENQWIKKITSSNLVQAKFGQAVLIICENIQLVYKISQNLEKIYDKNKIWKYTGQSNFKKEKIDSGEIIVATNIAGRGTDLTTTENVEKNGGLHVCVTLLPSSSRVELQNVGRTARQGKKGTAH